MKWMRSIMAGGVLFAATSGVVNADPLADVKKSIEDGRSAYIAGDYEKARNLFLSASQIEQKNAELLLMLGKAQYQLGELDAAAATFDRVQKLTPGESYSKRILEAIRGQALSVDVRLAIIGNLLTDEMFDAAAQEAQKLLAVKALPDAQRAQAMTHHAEALLGLNRPAEVVPLVREVAVRFPGVNEPLRLDLLLARALVRMDAQKAADGVAILTRLAGDADKARAAEAQYELIAYRVAQGLTAQTAATLGEWIAANPEHGRAREARLRFIEVSMNLASRPPRIDRAGGMLPEDKAAIAMAGEVLKRQVSGAAAMELTGRLVTHLARRYATEPALAAEGVGLLLAHPLPRESRLAALRTQLAFEQHVRFTALTARLAAGDPAFTADEVPAAIKDLVELNARLVSEYPEARTGDFELGLANLLAGIADPWPQRDPATVFPPRVWAIRIATPLVALGGEPSAKALKGIHAALDARPTLRRAQAADLYATVAAGVDVSRPEWIDVQWKFAHYLHLATIERYQENLSMGRPEANARLADGQKRLLGVLSSIAARRAADQPRVLEYLDAHLNTWLGGGHDGVFDEAYAAVLPALGGPTLLTARVAAARMEASRVFARHDRQVMAGLTVPKALDPALQKVVLAIYEMHRGKDVTDVQLPQIRSAWVAVVDHYKKLEMYQTAEAAAKLAGEPRIALADQYAQYQLAVMKDEAARRELALILKDPKASEKLKLLPSVTAAIDAYRQVIADHPASPQVGPSAEAILALAGVYAANDVDDVAAGIYGRFAEFAAGHKLLSEAPFGVVSVADRAAFASAGALEGHARRLLHKAMSLRKPGDPPPQAISDEYKSALAACAAFAKARPQSPLLHVALQRYAAVAMEYARVDAWDVADAVWAELQAAGLSIRRPERIEFARGLCQLGKAMPAHARDVMESLTLGPPIIVPVIRGVSDEVAHADVPTSPATRPAGLAAGEERLDADGRLVASIRGGPGGGGAGAASGPVATPAPAEPVPDMVRRQEDYEKQLDGQTLASIRRHEAERAQQVALLRDDRLSRHGDGKPGDPGKESGARPATVPVLSDTELARQQLAIDAAYDLFKTVRTRYPDTPTAQQARGEMLVMVSHWRTLEQWPRAAELARKFVGDNTEDSAVAQMRLDIGRDYLAWASGPFKDDLSRQALVAEVQSRFDKARAELRAIVETLKDQQTLYRQAQWDIAISWLMQAGVVDRHSPTLSRGQFVRAAAELRQAAGIYHDHPNIAQVPQLLFQTGQQLHERGHFDEAVLVWSDLARFDPTHPLAHDAAARIAHTWQNNLDRPMRAVEAYLEINFARGGSDQASQQAVHAIGMNLMSQKRWIESLHVLEVFVASFPRSPHAGAALTSIGQIHQVNEAWEDAIRAYKRVIADYPGGEWVQQARWSIAECTINLSKWTEAGEAYAEFVRNYPKDPRVAEANVRMTVLKDLVQYQTFVDEANQRRAHEVQFQIAQTVRQALANPQKAVIEFRKVADRYPRSHLADNALLEIGKIHLDRGETEKAREALLEMAAKYPDSNEADDALVLVGRSFEAEGQRLAGLTREASESMAQDKSQRDAYKQVAQSRVQLEQQRFEEVGRLRAEGKKDLASLAEAQFANSYMTGVNATVDVAAQQAGQAMEVLSAWQLADRQDKINAALRQAVDAYAKAAGVPQADQAGFALLRMSMIYDEQLKDSDAALKTWLEIVRQFGRSPVAEEANWRTAQYYERKGQHAQAIESYKSFLREYRASARAAAAQFAIAENYEHLGRWIEAMDAYKNYIANWPQGPSLSRAQERIGWIERYRL